MFQLKMITGPATPVVTVTELKEYLRVDGNLEDGRLQVMEAAAVQLLENEVSRKFVSQQWDVFLDQWPIEQNSTWFDGVQEIAISEVIKAVKNITLPLGVGISLDEFSTYSDDAEEIHNTTDYTFDSVGPRARIGLKLGAVWPTTILRSSNGIRFRCTFGFGTAAFVPYDIKQAVKELVAHMYENRGDQNEMTIPPHVFSLVNSYKRYKLGR